LLKRPDEKYVTEKAYDNAKFVEDVVRDISIALQNLGTINKFKIKVVNEESIHPHNAVAYVARKLQGKKIHCRRCERYLDKSQFWGDKETYCKECKKFVGINSNLKNKKLDIEKYSEIEKSQNGVCKICGGTDKKRLSVDHDHSCCSGSKTCGNCTRGLLCSRCNKTLGMVQDNPELLQKMINYLTIYLLDT
jgi:hypothetical protein